ncbi:trypsin-like peptidase domain-containing protein [Tuanshanicoccus lijuaniae]|uniref:S1C family serine protease n=1 Tax=Aerococcaceae bacterium zg-1292 TaxID=2774330 RepID=UPI00193565C8|nr:trypsin-like peptidase domain-containing protein [Aerococcaceae bacterium zg-1292]MBF6626833.1 trypsin-like peptidase domain-containing protein [Aerococcaceae bacterium zg-BR9]MBS4456778.1 trypsin-like peptidase domain-containing protein [Aerococcaceae bacterium zg-A91]MBS4458570.1 trypsin-like peptidase domain-containing protein [Aerococcaceae bacterium zg-BR33]QQA36702.1 trypsin-like peptidase domain-containing protein [Aerococcaceae bacterium zg-1292]
MDKQEKQRTTFWKSIFGGIIGSLLIISLIGFAFFNGGFTKPQSKVVQAEADSSKTLTDFESAIVGAVEAASDAAVSVTNFKRTMPRENSPFGDGRGYGYGYGEGGDIDLGEKDEALQPAGSGSGVVYRVDGDTAYVVTNHHVVNGAAKLQVTTADGTKEDAELVGSDVYTDLAVLKISSKHAKTSVKFADSDKIKVGSLAVAIGSPLGTDYAGSVTQGIVSGVNRILPFDINGDGEKDWEMNVLQTDAAINPGNSGGALVNKDGHLIGINSSKFSKVSVEGMGFAIPSNEVKRVIEELEANGKVIRPVLGINGVYAVSQLSARSKTEILKLPENDDKGVVIAEVAPNSSAAKAGLEQYDVIKAIEGDEVNDLISLRQALYKHKVGEKVKLTIMRNGKKQQVTVTLEAQAPQIPQTAPSYQEAVPYGRESEDPEQDQGQGQE